MKVTDDISNLLYGHLHCRNNGLVLVMPVYEFNCEGCAEIVEIQAKMIELFEIPKCSICDRPMKRNYHNPAFIPTKGMYSHDSRSK